MGSLDQPPSGATSTSWRLPDIHPEGRKYVLIAATAAFLSFFLWDFLTWPLIGLTIWVAAFFRDPVRVTPQGADLIVAPADGLITMIERVPVPLEMAGEAALGAAALVRVSIYMSVFDVHINRTPIAGTIRHVIYLSGKFLNAEFDKASEENERQHIVIEARDGRRIGFTQIAGLVSRRIVAFVKPGDIVASGQRVGLIRFGSRVDLYLPDDITCQVVVGQRAVAGETIIGRAGGPSALGIAQ
ncbi:MAG: phosphatidylserine decarboxylase family protein [Sphingobium sp.]|nr:phosphatidylserine decarboxylase family protein [Sphingobium sp.]